MRIDPSHSISPVSLDAPKPQTPSTPPAAPAAASVVTLSAAATAHPSAQPAINVRLEKIRAMLESGEYPVDLDMLASRIIDDEMLRSRKPS
ncbi:MAG: hypothetical protein ABI867_01185 [Kofleriaceae bacterium]